MFGKTGNRHPRFRKKHTEESRNKISDKLRGENHPNFGKSGNLPKTSRPIIQMDLNGIELKTWPSMLYATKQLGIDRSTVSKCCRGMKKTCGGFKWKYANDKQTKHKQAA